MTDRLTVLRAERDQALKLLGDYEAGRLVHHAGGNLDDPTTDITDERKTTLRGTIERLDQKIAECEADSG